MNHPLVFKSVEGLAVGLFKKPTYENHPSGLGKDGIPLQERLIDEVQCRIPGAQGMPSLGQTRMEQVRTQGIPRPEIRDKKYHRSGGVEHAGPLGVYQPPRVEHEDYLCPFRLMVYGRANSFVTG